MYIRIETESGIAYLNADHIVTIERKNDLTRISMSNSDVHYTKAFPSDIFGMIK